MKIYFNGCSWTYGKGLDNFKKDRFSKIICDELGVEETNFSYGGISNDNIIRHLISEDDIKKYDLAIIQMTFPARTEFYKKDKWVKVNPHYDYSKLTVIDKLQNKDSLQKGVIPMPPLSVRWSNKNNDESARDEDRNFWNDYFKYLTNQKFIDMREKIQFQIIKNHCNSKGVPLILCSINPWTKLSFDLKLNNKKLPRAKCGHPNEKGHDMIAKKLLDKI